MKIIILGAGEVGATLAENLAQESNDVTIVDIDESLLSPLQDRLDIRAVQGYAAYPDTLREAGADDADMVIAVTAVDEVNMVACQIAYTLFQIPTKIARIRATEYLVETELFEQGAIPINLCISPERLVTNHIKRLIEYPGALQVVDFADGRVQVVGVRAYYGGPLIGNELQTLDDHLPDAEACIVALYRRGRPVIPNRDTVIEADDEVYFIAARQHVKQVISELRRMDRPVKRLMLAGGGNIGTRLALALEKQCQIKIIEQDPTRAAWLSEQLNRSIVLHGDAANESLLREENIESMDVFCSITNDDEANILSAMLAKRLGSRKAMSLINRLAYVDLIESSGTQVDLAISPKHSTISALLAYVRRGDVVRAHTLRRGGAEAIEVIAHGTPGNSRVVGHRLEDINLPPGTNIGALTRGDEVLIARPETVIEAGDHVMIFIIDKEQTVAVEQLFQVGFSYI